MIDDGSLNGAVMHGFWGRTTLADSSGRPLALAWHPICVGDLGVGLADR